MFLLLGNWLFICGADSARSNQRQATTLPIANQSQIDVALSIRQNLAGLARSTYVYNSSSRF